MEFSFDKETYPKEDDLHPLNKAVILPQYADLFKGVGQSPNECDIMIDTNVPPVVHPPRRVLIAVRDNFKTELDHMEQDDVITKVTTPSKRVNSIVYSNSITNLAIVSLFIRQSPYMAQPSLLF